MVSSGLVAFLVLSAAQAARASRSFRWTNVDASDTKLDDQKFWDADQQYWNTQFRQLQKELFQFQKSAAGAVTVDLQVN